MKLPMKWIAEYAPIPVSPAEYQNRMIMSGTDVEGTEDLSGGLEGVVVGRVLTVAPVENSDHLHVCQVDVGEAEALQVVCGAPNVAPGILVPVATVGATLPDGTKIKKGKLRGVESQGMLCSATELNVPTDLYPSIGDEGLLIFQEDYPLGADVKPILGIDDTVVDFSILANRPDCLCAWGMARETAVTLNTSFQKPEIKVVEAGGDIHEHIAVTVEDSELCPRYIARVVKNIRIGPSPFWLRKYLHGAGMRSINNIVDITNYVMLETGHPMHAFDLSKVAGNHIIVRKAKPGEKLTTLDGKERQLSGIELLICDEKGPTGLAGVMGGEESEIAEETKAIVFECAVFDRANTRMASRALGLRTESSSRFEKGVSAATAMEAMDRACQLVNLLDAGDVVSGAIDLYPAPKKPQVITAICTRIAKRTGVDIPHDAIVEILEKLHFQVEKKGDALTVTVPPFRQDVDGEADLCEEVLRIYGYDHIPATPLRGEMTQGGRNDKMRQKDEIIALLSGMGYNEIMRFSFIGAKAIEKLNLPKEDWRNSPLKIRNPLGEDTAYMRPSLAPGVLETLGLNIHQGNSEARAYEIGMVFDPFHPTEERLPREVSTLAVGCYGEGIDFYHIRGLIEMLLHHFGVSYRLESGGDAYHHPGRSARIFYEDQLLCVLGEVHPGVAENFGITKRAYLAELNLDTVALLAVPMGSVKPLPKYPAVTRDLALVMGDVQPVGPVMESMTKAGGKLLESIELFDIYRGAQLGHRMKSVAFALTFRGEDHTLTEGEVAASVEKILKTCKEAYGATLRM